jgi:uncharacterized protein DUF551
MSEWRDISTAPKDGTRILIFEAPDAFNPDGVIVSCWWYANDTYTAGGYWNGGRGTLRTFLPTHWMPLPAAPPREER